ncbi:hypothetical protein JOF36_004219 [Pseudonocardia parietis]|uniref:Uncharacterized protein n=1 Tax=Pseudonocardia parietis TaxID=570936 RepID=A0ABS4VX97_9PSEU|nr:hypothetical protein [Pseudonocardia parietis]MBP2368523.1 hypothetical protein [Pseudonocardia parietis]
MTGGRESRVGGPVCTAAETAGEELGRRALTERPRPYRDGAGVAGELAEHGGVHRAVRRPQSGGEEHGQPVEAAREVGEEPQRRAVAPVQVVHDDRERTVRGEVDGQPVQAVQRRERRLGRHRVAAEFDDGGEDVAGRGRRAGEGTPTARVAQGRLEQLPDHSERERLLERAAPGREDAQAGRRGTAAHLHQQPGLADAGRALQEHDDPLAAGDPADRRVQGGDLVLALEQRPRRPAPRVTHPIECRPSGAARRGRRVGRRDAVARRPGTRCPEPASGRPGAPQGHPAASTRMRSGS